MLQDMVQQHYLTQPPVQGGPGPAAPHGDQSSTAPGADGRAVLHQLAAAPDPPGHGLWPARCPRQGRRIPGVLRRVEDQDHPRPQDAGGGRPGHLQDLPYSRVESWPRWWRSTTRPDRSGRWSVAQWSTATRTTSSSRSTWPLRPSASPDRRSSRSRWPSHSSRATGRLGVPLRAPASSSSRTAAARSSSTSALRQRLLRTDHTPRRPRTSRITRCSPGWGSSGKDGGTKRIARLAEAMGIRTHVSHNYAMILGGLKVGVSPLDMAHAYETLATAARRSTTPCWATSNQGPTGLAEIQCPRSAPSRRLRDKPVDKRVIPPLCGHHRTRHARGPGGFGHGHGGGHPRGGRGGQDRDHDELRRRLVRGLDPGDDCGGLGGLPQQHHLHEHPVQRRPRGGRDLPGDHLARLHGPGAPGPGRRAAPESEQQHVKLEQLGKLVEQPVLVIFVEFVLLLGIGGRRRRRGIGLS